MHTRNSDVVVVTGASAGVGRATAVAFGKRGARVALLARSSPGLQDASRDVQAAGGTALPIEADVADADAVEAAAESVENEFGEIDVWVNNAMVSVFSRVREMEADEIRRVTDVTYHGTVYGTLSALRRMYPRDRGVIVQVGSALAYRSVPLQAAYCGAKHAIRGFTDSLRSELIRDDSGVQVTMVHVPAINTPQFRWVKSRLPNKSQPVPPIYQPEFAAEAIYWAAYHPRREFAFGFSTIQAILGSKFIPGLLDRYLARAAFEGQQTDMERDPNEPDNLWSSVPGKHSTRGDFNDKSAEYSYQGWFARHKNAVIAGALGLGVGAAGAFFSAGR